MMPFVGADLICVSPVTLCSSYPRFILLSATESLAMWTVLSSLHRCYSGDRSQGARMELSFSF